MKVTEKCPTCIFKYIHQLYDNTEHTERQPTDTKHEADRQKDGICSSLILLLAGVWHPALLQEEEDLDVDDRDHHQGKDELEYTRENCVP